MLPVQLKSSVVYSSILLFILVVSSICHAAFCSYSIMSTLCGRHEIQLVVRLLSGIMLFYSVAVVFLLEFHRQELRWSRLLVVSALLAALLVSFKFLFGTITVVMMASGMAFVTQTPFIRDFAVYFFAIAIVQSGLMLVCRRFATRCNPAGSGCK